MKIDLLLNIIKQPSILLLRDYKEVNFLRNSHQAAKSFVEKAYQRTKELLEKQLSTTFPRHEITYSENVTGSSFIYLEPIEGIDNLISGLPFFGMMMLITSQVGMTKYETALINLPCLDLSIFYQSNSYTIAQNIERGRTRANIAAAGEITLTTYLNDSIANSGEMNNFRVTGSNAYNLAMFLQGRGKRLVLDHPNPLSERIADLLVLGAGGSKQQNKNYSSYSI